MAGTLSPIPASAQNLEGPMPSRVHSPTKPLFLGPNDDKLERARARAERAAAIRRRSINAIAPPPTPPDTDPCLGKQQILDLFQNCIKLASENKINQKNTWELGLIDHLCEIIKVEEEDDVETNFQKASCSLEAGVKIYSMRVDSVHSEAYKVLGGINRVGQENEQVDAIVEESNINVEQEECHSKKEQGKKMSPSSTLESSFAALNVKKFDVAFAVDPLYHQTSAQFDEGGAKGLLLNNLGVYGGCQVLFDSMEVPGKCIPCEKDHNTSDTVDITFAKESFDMMALNMQMKDEISPTLRYLVNQFDEDRPTDTFSSGDKTEDHAETVYDHEAEVEGDDAFEHCGPWTVDQDDHTSLLNEDIYAPDSNFQCHNEESEPFTFYESNSTDDRFEKVDGHLFLSLGFTSKQNAWAGPDHWKYRKVKGSEDTSAAENRSSLVTKKSRNKKVEIEIDFTKPYGNEISDVFAPPKNPKSLLLPANRAPCNTTLPEDCHYQPEDLVKLFLLPNVMCLGKRTRKCSDESLQEDKENGPYPLWDDDVAFGDDGNFHSDVEDSNGLVAQPRLVNKVEVEYDKTSKQVDVQALKQTLWNHIKKSPQKSVQGQEETSFRDVLASFPKDNTTAVGAAHRDISPHLCFICLLHLANEHGLSLHGCTTLDELTIRLPRHDILSPVN